MTEPALSCPPEWAPQAAVWVGWPRLEEEWGEAFELARMEVAGFVRMLAVFTPVRLVAGCERSADEAYVALGDVAEIVRAPMGDIWLRDTGPVIGQDAGGAWRGATFRFNGWGGKYVMPGDTDTAAGLLADAGLAASAHAFVLEGGAIEQDGAGRLLTTRQCLLNPNRNPGWTEIEAEAALRAAFGPLEITWLDHGLTGDHTDGHIDNLARFTGPGEVICQAASGADDPNAELYRRVYETLTAAGLTVHTVPSPGRIEDRNGAPLPASHMNFLITNAAVLMPAFESEHAEAAATALAAHFPGRDVIPLPARHILEGGGTFHCMTQQVPAGALGGEA